MSHRLLGALAGAAAVAGMAAAGCATVPAWQRAALAHRCMAAELDPDEAAWRHHMLAAREGSEGAEAGGASAGCGCN